MELIEEVSRTPRELPDCVVRRITYLKSLIAGAEDSKRLLEARAQAQVDTVNSLISQRHAEASLNESYVMRIMAIVTLIFLPATAVAVRCAGFPSFQLLTRYQTMFSTSFWNWMPDARAKENDSVVSHWIWIYFLCSIVLSLAVYVFTYVMHQRKRERRNRRLGSNRRAVAPSSKKLRTLSTKDFDDVV